MSEKFTRDATPDDAGVEPLNRAALDFRTEDGDEIRVGDAVTLFGVPGRVVVEQAAIGVECDTGIDWDAFQELAVELTQSLYACHNDTFVSLWELAWNLDATEDGIIPGLLADRDRGAARSEN